MIEIIDQTADQVDELEIHTSEKLPDALPVLPLKDTVTFPETVTRLAVGQDRSIKLVDDVLAANRMLVMVASKNPDLDMPGPEELYRVGVVGTVARMLKMPDGTLRILVQGAQRVRIHDFVSTDPYLVARIIEEPDVIEPSQKLEALVRTVQQSFSKIIEFGDYLPDELHVAVANIDDPSALAHMIAGALRVKSEEKQELLEEVDVANRLMRLSKILARELEVVELGSKIQSQVQSEVDKSQREYFLRQQQKAIQEELGEGDEQQSELNELRKQMEEAELPEVAQKQADRELSRLESLPPAAAEHGVIRTYLEWIISLPWNKQTEDDLDLKHAHKILDEDHYDLDKVKERILEYLAVRSLKSEAVGPILCFVGPPGVGKTSLGKSIARALGREFARISVGGVRDEAEIRGHRRTYIGAMPGTILRAIRDAGTKNPVFMIDEIDKMGADFRGDPSSAMLEVLDPEQHDTFRDHYLDLPFDLSKILFITTANMPEPIPSPLRDRMEVIDISGYTEEEKHHIARRFLVKRQIERNGLTSKQIKITDKAIDVIIEEYTREAGVRNLEREIGSLCRKVARGVADGKVKRKVVVGGEKVRKLLGKRKFFSESKRRTEAPGVATGLAWTPTGGDILFIEASIMPGKGKLNITGQLGDVMTESAEAALSYVRANADKWDADLPREYFQKHDIHLHVPAGAIPKDGPSAGIAMATALISLVTGKSVAGDIAMTGELTLTGKVLPIGGLKEKALAAQRAGIKTVIAPELNEQDTEDIPKHLRSDIDFVFVKELDGVLDVALEGWDGSPSKSARKRPAGKPHKAKRKTKKTSRGKKTRR